MKLVILSDTHEQHEGVEVPDGDVLIHCGDGTVFGGKSATKSWMEWMERQPHKHKLFISGNHDFLAEQRWSTFKYLLYQHDNLIYLQNTGVELDGIKFWGSPVQPWFPNWAFQKQRGAELKVHWEQIPEDTDVLITHGPPKGFGDINRRDERFGDEDLLTRVLEVKPQIHCYGHAHHGYGEYFFEGIHFINAAVLNEAYMLQNKPIVVDIEV